MKVIIRQQLPTNLPIWPSVVCWLLLDRLQPASWVWGSVITVLVIFWIAAIVHLFREKPTKVFRDDD